LVKKLGYYHAGVFIKETKIAHVYTHYGSSLSDKNNFAESKIFQFGTFEEFLGEYKTILIKRMVSQSFTERDIEERASKLANKVHLYNLYDNNCEHLAFQCVYGIKFAT
jgi:hypothetical protein